MKGKMYKISEEEIEQFYKENPEWRPNEKDGLKIMSSDGFEAFRKWQEKKNKQNATN